MYVTCWPAFVSIVVSIMLPYVFLVAGWGYQQRASEAAAAVVEVVPWSAAPKLKLLAVHDGDTITADVVYPFSVALQGQHIRCDAYDAWEIARGRGGVVITDEELKLGKVARDALSELLSKAKVIYAVPGKGDRTFGRLVVRVYCEQNGAVVDVAEWMTTHGHARKDL